MDPEMVCPRPSAPVGGVDNCYSERFEECSIWVTEGCVIWFSRAIMTYQINRKACWLERGPGEMFIYRSKLEYNSSWLYVLRVSIIWDDSGNSPALLLPFDCGAICFMGHTASFATGRRGLWNHAQDLLRAILEGDHRGSLLRAKCNLVSFSMGPLWTRTVIWRCVDTIMVFGLGQRYSPMGRGWKSHQTVSTTENSHPEQSMILLTLSGVLGFTLSGVLGFRNLA